MEENILPWLRQEISCSNIDVTVNFICQLQDLIYRHIEVEVKERFRQPRMGIFIEKIEINNEAH